MTTLSRSRRDPRASVVERRGRLVYVTGGKGGVGKTLLAARVAARLAREGARVLLADLDLGLANADVLLQHCATHGLADALRDSLALRDCAAPTAHGFDLLAGVAGEREWAALTSERRGWLVGGLRDLTREYDVVVADGSPGIGADVLAFAAAADRVLLVTTPDPLALADGYGLLKALHETSAAGGPEIPTPEIVVNRARDLAQAESTAQRLRDVAERFLARSPRWAGWLPESALLARPGRAPVALDSETIGAHAEACLAQLAKRLKPEAGPFDRKSA